MATNIPIRITDAEWEVMRVVWAHGHVTSKEIIQVLEKKTNWKAATIKTLIGRLLEKEMLEATPDGRRFIYSAAVAEEDSIHTYTDEVLSRVCKKEAGQVIGHMLKEATFSHEDIKFLETILNQKKVEAVDEVKCECVMGQCECHMH